MFPQPVTSCDTCPLGATGRACPFRPVNFAAKVRLCGQGEVAPRVIFVRDGVLALTSTGPDGAEGEVALRGPRSLVCSEALFGASSAKDVRALSPVKVCVAGRGELERWLGPDDSPVRRFVQLLLNELERRGDDSDLRRGSALHRVARLLSMCAADDRELGEIPKNVFARSLGLRAETFARCLRKLSDRGLIVAAPKLKVLDPEGLRAVA